MPNSETPSADAFATRLGAARRGDLDALGSLLDAFRPYLLAIAHGRIPEAMKSRGGDSDLVQDSLCDALRAFHRFQGDRPDQLRAWLREILRNNLADWIKSHAAGRRDVSRDRRMTDPAAAGLADSDPTPGAREVKREESNELEAALRRLPDDERSAIVLRNKEHLTFEEIGSRLDRTSEAARKLWARAVARLQRILEESDGQ